MRTRCWAGFVLEPDRSRLNLPPSVLLYLLVRPYVLVVLFDGQ